jgi:hypothetical protein
VQYFALLRDGGTAKTASGLVRRTHTSPIPTDEAIGRDLIWHPTEYPRLYRLGHNGSRMDVTTCHTRGYSDARHPS